MEPLSWRWFCIIHCTAHTVTAWTAWTAYLYAQLSRDPAHCRCNEPKCHLQHIPQPSEDEGIAADGDEADLVGGTRSKKRPDQYGRLHAQQGPYDTVYTPLGRVWLLRRLGREEGDGEDHLRGDSEKGSEAHGSVVWATLRIRRTVGAGSPEESQPTVNRGEDEEHPREGSEPGDIIVTGR
ncbi:hypothetical protein PGQ11_009022 [Apiospora arundinis]|uniref:Uncharacterized protein n=1 Tax=Apiospora arundinis TaxID=335852 RepID=A0ABR2IGT6_9PEZI